MNQVSTFTNRILLILQFYHQSGFLSPEFSTKTKTLSVPRVPLALPTSSLLPRSPWKWLPYPKYQRQGPRDAGSSISPYIRLLWCNSTLLSNLSLTPPVYICYSLRSDSCYRPRKISWYSLDELVLEPLWIFWRRGKYLPLPGIEFRSLGHSHHIDRATPVPADLLVKQFS